MEPVAVTPECRGRKRKRKDVQSPMSGRRAKRKGVATRGKMQFVGRYMMKDFDGSGIFLGKIIFYEDGLYRVEYEDGDCEDLDDAEVKNYLIEDGALDNDLVARKSKLDELIAKKNMKHVEATANDAKKVEISLLSREIDAIESVDDGDLSSDSLDYDLDRNMNSEVVPFVPPPQLPPSSGNIGVPEEYVSYLLSVYGFLRSFSIQLFLSPFGLDDFVGSLNCPLQNTLLDAIHVALMRVLKRHLEMLTSDGSELASKCTRLTDWSLLDTLTWPTFLVLYLMIMGHISGPQWKGFYVDALEKKYYSLPTGRKLMILQFLCDDVLESVELTSEIDIREEAEVGIDPDAVAASVSETGTKRVHPRHSKTNTNGGVKGSDTNDEADIVDDDNGDECRLCGMDGTLLCCDGCPSVYHSRCIGVSKMFIPEGTWYCHECTISRTGLTIAKGTSLTGAEVFGVDSYGYVYIGSCNHLLVLEVSSKSEPSCKYYHQKDIPKVLQALLLSAQHIMLYSDICKAILRYWDIQKDVIIPFLVKVEMDEQSTEVKDISQCPTPINNEPFLVKVEMDEQSAEVKDISRCPTPINNEPFLVKVEMDEQSAEVKDISQRPTPINILGGESHKLLGVVEGKELEGFITETGSVLNKSSLNTRTTGSYNGRLDMLFESNEDIKRVVGAGNKKSSDGCFYMGLHFKSQAYINNYSQGDFAASAAVNLAVLSSEEKEVAETHAPDKRRKMALADNLLQMKAFSSVAIRFFWPTAEKKLVEVPRERCGWCLSCKSSAISKKACLLNAAASTAIKGAIKTLGGLPTIKNGEGSLHAIASYIILIEESLSGLVVCPFRTAMNRKQWRKRVGQATTCEAIKSLLLELEGNIRAVALSPDWFKLVESWLIESSMTQSATTATGSTQKRGLSGRRGRKPSAVSETESDDQTESSKDFIWWRGGVFSKLILQRGVLPSSVVKKAARQGGSRWIPGIVYAEGCEIPKRSRQFFWRAAVEMSKNASELALQVRRLDLYVRWSDLIRPEQTLQVGKGQEIEALAFRNARVCDKKIVEDKIIYGVAFGNQKHLPSRVMKNIIEVEQSQDGKKKYWFSETRVPLYLIKEYEEKIDKMQLPLPEKPANLLSDLQKKQLKACRRDIFSYMSCKRDNLVKCGCASCQLDVLIRNALKCNVCEGFCHERCTIGSTKHKDDKVEHMITCKLCTTRTLPQSKKESPTSPLLFQGKDSQNVVTPRVVFKMSSFHKPVTPVGHVNSPLEMRSGSRSSSAVSKEHHKIASWGLIFKKNKDGKSREDKEKEDEDGLRFRMSHILRKNKSARNSGGPICHLCDQPYNPNLAYILCGSCMNWYHTDSLELEESKISDLVGFKCCRCRRIRSPDCPYLDSNKKKALESKIKRLHVKGPKRLHSESDSFNSSISDQPKEIESTSLLSLPTEVVPCMSGDDSLLYSLSMDEQFSEPTSEIDTQWDSVNSASRTGPQKLQVRRIASNDTNTDTEQGIIPDHVQDYSLLPCVEWGISENAFEDANSFDCNGLNFEDMEFEPQTYFSFNELLGPDETNGAQVDETNADTIDCGEMCIDDFEITYGDSQNGFLEELVMVDNDYTGQELVNIPAETSDNVILCQNCFLADPSPDLWCQVCGLCLHSHCSPWVEQCSSEGQWKCGKCREWC